MVGRIPQAGEFQDHVLEEFKGFHTGPTSLLDDNFLEVAKNVLVGKNGELYKRPGLVTYTSSLPGKVMPCNIYNSGVKSHLIGVAKDQNFGPISGKVYNSIDSGVTWNAISSATTHIYQPGVNYLTSVWGISDVGIWGWDGTTFTDFVGAAYPTSGLRPCFIQFRMFIIDTSGNIRFSDPGNFGSWPAANTIGFPGDGQPVIGIIPFRDNLVIFRSQSTYVLQMAGAATPSNWVLRELAFGLGCVNEQAMAVYRDVLFFSSFTGIYATDLTTLTKVSEPIDKVFNGRASQIAGGASTIPVTWGTACPDQIVVYNNKLYCIVNVFGLAGRQHMEDNGVSNAALNSVTAQLEPKWSTTYVYDLVLKTWTELVYNTSFNIDLSPLDATLGVEVWKRNPQSMYVVPNSYKNTTGYINEGIYHQHIWNIGGGSPARLMHYSENTHVRDVVLETAPYIHAQYLPYTDPDGNFETKVKTTVLDFGLPNQLKRCPLVSLGLNSGESHNTASVNTSINCNYYVDDAIVASTTAPTNSVQSKQSKIRGPGWFRKLQIELVDTSAGYWELLNIVPSVRAKRKLSEART